MGLLCWKVMFQYSTYDKVYNGNYDGGITVSDLKIHGNFGLGTFHQLEGELVALDNSFYHCYNQDCRIAGANQTLAWAAICFFPEQSEVHHLKNMQYADLRDENSSFLNSILNAKDYLIAIKIQGFFTAIELTSTPKQQKPYPSIQTVIDNSIKYPLKNITGSLIGWYAPHYMGGIKQPGFHFHFVDDKKQIGGHVLEFHLENASAQCAQMHTMRVDFAK